MSDIVYIIISAVVLICSGVLIGYQESKIKDLKHKIDLLEQEKKIKGY